MEIVSEKSLSMLGKPTNNLFDSLWQKRRRGTPISSPILKEKASCENKKWR